MVKRSEFGKPYFENKKGQQDSNRVIISKK